MLVILQRGVAVTILFFFIVLIIYIVFKTRIIAPSDKGWSERREKTKPIEIHHVMHHFFDAVCVEGFIHSKKTADMTNGNNKVEDSSKS